MVRVVPPPKAIRKKLKNGSGVCYKGKLLGKTFCFNIYHNNKLFNLDIETDFDDPVYSVIEKNKDFIRIFFIEKELTYMAKL